MTTDLSQLVTDFSNIFKVEQEAIVRGRADLELKKVRRTELQTLLNEINEAHDNLFRQYMGLPDMPNEATMDWATAVLAMPNMAILVLDTTGVRQGSDIINFHAINNKGEVLLDHRVKPARHGTANTDFTGIQQTEIDDAPSLASSWDFISGKLRGCYIISFNLDFVRQHLADNLKHYGLPSFPFLGDCLMKQSKAYFGIDEYGYNSGLKLPDAVARIGKPFPYSPPLAQDRAVGCLALLNAMSNGITSTPSAPAVEDHPF
jgi:hypothetical protein